MHIALNNWKFMPTLYILILADGDNEIRGILKKLLSGGEICYRLEKFK